ncbi:hypothetical protein C8024_17085 [Sphingopyxis sp. BSNA05]|uniref:hypothetical protein n=1 Tax=Sphingopyxis sp. BSNA05 TaxID=1236614 RepID=UPI001565ADEA|nr:hypothetical protein [Sphingopyxis sp. BSNA05]NRD90785.1 hypothetical protein [Sphingopyxis sp. BSNA05]
MRHRQAIYAFAALAMVNGIAADARSSADERQIAQLDLSGSWQQADGDVLHFTQDGTSLTSRYLERSANNDADDIDFTATIHGNLVYGAHRAPFSRAMQKKCALQIWVGMGLTLNEGGTELRGFRGDRIVDPESCNVTDSAPVAVVYTRIADSATAR